MATGNPNGGKINNWAPYNAEVDESLSEFGETIAPIRKIRRAHVTCSIGLTACFNSAASHDLVLGPILVI